MSGKKTKYYFYEDRGSGSITIPISMAKGLNWNHKDEINILIKTIDGYTGLFLFKKEN
ncbi:MAG: hypothetical protein ACFFDN_00355 [Candidatus Hodarchaeota archaeon]